MAEAAPEGPPDANSTSMWGRYDRPEIWQASLSGKPLFTDEHYSELAFFNCSVDPIMEVTEHVDVLPTIMAYAKIRATLKGFADRPGAVLAYTIAEALAHYLPAEKRLANVSADQRIISDVNAMFPLHTGSLRISGQNWTNARNAVFPSAGAVGSQAAVPTGGPIANLDLQQNAPVQTIQEALAVLRVLACHWWHDSTQAHVASIQVSLLMALAKRGCATAGYVREICDVFYAEAGYQLDPIPDCVDLCEVWKMISPYITDMNVGAIIQSWSACIPQDLLRLRLTLQQIPGQGLTALSAIKTALTSYPNFNWAHVAVLLENEAAAVQEALTAVGANIYYGYRRDLGPARSTRYKSFAWVAKELLIRKGGQSSLRAYKGWTPVPQKYHELEKMIANYVKNVQQEQVYAVGTPQHNIGVTLAAAAVAATGLRSGQASCA
ncbi:uncharacterized protein LOC108670604 [Hyalella azteca]|uniref:Uncharacterized protein LOC108670604 n=1 Tax=Hyalella azteca TaxID=294128 RepID=A0A8B7NIU8_HYAAZ|nr:uncharacterized protein LOC108670604 [Hyalella azteca]